MRRGFTLVELLIVMAIIATLAAMSYGAVFLAQETARRERTAAIVQKLHNVVIDRWESYRLRRINPTSAVDTGVERLGARREVLRMEMPDRYDDLVFAPTLSTVTGLRNAYLRRVNAARVKYNAANATTYANSTAFVNSVLGTGTNANESAECLYLWITASLTADERADFKGKDVGDTNNNFMPEFIDGWGRPIHWLRWAPGFASDVRNTNAMRHHDPLDPAGTEVGWSELFTDSDGDGTHDSGEPYIDDGEPNNPSGNGQFDTLQQHAPPLASGEVVPFSVDADGQTRVAWAFAIVPLIYSGGPDGEVGIFEGIAATSPAPVALIAGKNAHPYARFDDGSGTYLWRGSSQLNADGDTVHLDNIHNHLPQGM